VIHPCPDCVSEGKESPTTADAFYWVGKKQSQYCREHHDRRNAVRQAERLNPASPDYDPAFHEQRKRTQQSYYQRKLNPASPDYDPELHARQRAAKLAAYEKRKKGKG